MSQVNIFLHQIQHLETQLLPHYTTRHQNGFKIQPIDCLNTIRENVEMETDIVASARTALNKVNAVTWDLVKQATLRDDDLQHLKSYIINSFPPSSNTFPSNIQLYWPHHHDLSIVDEVILIGDCIPIPPPLRNKVCKLLHSGVGTSAINEWAKLLYLPVFWPGITK